MTRNKIKEKKRHSKKYIKDKKTKMKTKRSANKRYTITGTGKVKYKKQNLRHILIKKSQKRKRNLRKSGILSDSEAKKVAVLLPYN